MSKEIYFQMFKVLVDSKNSSDLYLLAFDFWKKHKFFFENGDFKPTNSNCPPPHELEEFVKKKLTNIST